MHALRWTSGLAALAAARDLGIPVVQEFSSLGVAERRAAAADGRVKADGASAARIRLEPAIGRSATAVVATNSAEVADLARLGVHRSSIRMRALGRRHRPVHARRARSPSGTAGRGCLPRPT